jgi:hypothetical protein
MLGVRVDARFDSRARRAIDCVNVFHEHLLHQPIRFFHVRVVVTFTNLADLLQRAIAQDFSGFAERLERVF